jgi:hypothetical protein
MKSESEQGLGKIRLAVSGPERQVRPGLPGKNFRFQERRKLPLTIAT